MSAPPAAAWPPRPRVCRLPASFERKSYAAPPTLHAVAFAAQDIDFALTVVMVVVCGACVACAGVGLSFGPDVTAGFLANNNLQLVVRSHEVRDEGYEMEHGGNLITVFSAPNYCDQMGNKGAFIRFHLHDNLEPHFQQYDAVPHPDVRPMQYANTLAQ